MVLRHERLPKMSDLDVSDCDVLEEKVNIEDLVLPPEPLTSNNLDNIPSMEVKKEILDNFNEVTGDIGTKLLFEPKKEQDEHNTSASELFAVSKSLKHYWSKNKTNVQNKVDLQSNSYVTSLSEKSHNSKQLT